MSAYSETEIELLDRRDSRASKPLVYLACPYSHVSPRIRQFRFEEVTKAAGMLIRNYGWNVFSPITHSHPLHELAGLQGDWAFWKKIDTEYIELSHTVVVFCVPGWRHSTGVQAEIQIAKDRGISIKYLVYRGPDNYLLSDYEQ